MCLRRPIEMLHPNSMRYYSLWMDTFVARGRWTAKFEATVMISASDNIPFSACIKATISKGHPNTLKLSVTTCYSVVSRRVKDRAMVSSWCWSISNLGAEVHMGSGHKHLLQMKRKLFLCLCTTFPFCFFPRLVNWEHQRIWDWLH